MDKVKKKVGNACRSKGQIRNSKTKGRSFEYDCETSLQQMYPDAYLTHQKGYVKEYDIHSEKDKLAFECKRIKGISWNKLFDLLEHLKSVTPDDFTRYIIFQSNMQPPLVFYETNLGIRQIRTFIEVFGIPFIKHTPVRKPLKVLNLKDKVVRVENYEDITIVKI